MFQPSPSSNNKRPLTLMPLPASQHLHAGDVAILLVDEVLPRNLYSIDEDADGRLAALYRGNTAQADPERALPVTGVYTEVRHHGGEVGDAADIRGLECVA